MVPVPPKVLTPPTTTAATTCNSSPWAATTVMVPNRARKRKPGQAAERAAERVGADRHAAHGQAGHGGGIWVGADGVEAAAPRQVGHHQLEDEHNDDGNEHNQLDFNFTHHKRIDLGQIDQPLRQGAGDDRLGVGKLHQDGAVDGQGAERGDDGGHTAV